MKPSRIQRKRARGWRMPQNTIYVGRPTRWGNPWRVDQPEHDHSVSPLQDSKLSAASAVRLYREWIEVRDWQHKRNGRTHGREPYTLLIRELLRGKNLACWCPLDQPCHADVLLEIANS